MTGTSTLQRSLRRFELDVILTRQKIRGVRSAPGTSPRGPAHKLMKLLWAGLLAFAVLCVEQSALAQTCVSPPAGIVSWWPADGHVNDIVGAKNGTLQGTPTFQAGVVGQAI